MILGSSFQRMHSQHFAKVNNKSFGFVNEFKTKAISRYIKKTIVPYPKRLFLNCQACRKPLAKPYNSGELCKPLAKQTGSSWEVCLPQAGPTPGAYQLPEKGFLPRELLSPPTHLAKDPKGIQLWQLLQNPHCHPWYISQRPSPADGCSRGKAIDLNISEGSRPLLSAQDDRLLHSLRQKKKWKKKPKSQPHLSACSSIGISCAFTTREHGPPHRSPSPFSFYCKNLLLKHTCQQPV